MVGRIGLPFTVRRLPIVGPPRISMRSGYADAVGGLVDLSREVLDDVDGEIGRVFEMREKGHVVPERPLSIGSSKLSREPLLFWG